jgi:hypothetical protein
MIPPHVPQRQTTYQVRSIFPSFLNPNGNLEYILDADGLRIQTAIAERFSFIKYSDIKSVRLDYSKRGGKNQAKKRCFHCHINDEIKIETKWLYRGLWGDDKDKAYNHFVLALHTKLAKFPNEERTFYTGLTEGDYDALLVGIAFAWIVAACLGLGMLNSGSRFDPGSLLFVGFFLLLSLFAAVNNKPKIYEPNYIPGDFLS